MVTTGGPQGERFRQGELFPLGAALEKFQTISPAELTESLRGELQAGLKTSPLEVCNYIAGGCIVGEPSAELVGKCDGVLNRALPHLIDSIQFIREVFGKCQRFKTELREVETEAHDLLLAPAEKVLAEALIISKDAEVARRAAQCRAALWALEQPPFARQLSLLDALTLIARPASMLDQIRVGDTVAGSDDLRWKRSKFGGWDIVHLSAHGRFNEVSVFRIPNDYIREAIGGRYSVSPLKRHVFELQRDCRNGWTAATQSGADEQTVKLMKRFMSNQFLWAVMSIKAARAS